MCSKTPVYSITVEGRTYHLCPTHAAAVAAEIDLLGSDPILIPMDRRDSEVLVCDGDIADKIQTPSS